MTAVLRGLTGRLVSARRAGSTLALLIDYGGTLAPVVEHPALARLEPATRGLLRRLASRPGVAVGIASGRRLADLQGLVGLPGLHYAGTGGMELDLLGRKETHPDADELRTLIGAVWARLGGLEKEHRGVWVEDKGFGLTLHYRDVPPHRVEPLGEKAAELFGEFAGLLRVTEGPMSWEIAPAVAWDKGNAMQRIAGEAGGRVVAVYAGDAADDEAGFEAAVALGGVSIGVGPFAPESACYRLSGAAEFVSFLADLDAGLAAPASDTDACHPVGRAGQTATPAREG